MVHPITDGIDNTDHQMLLTVDDIRESDRARTIAEYGRDHNQGWTEISIYVRSES